MPFTTPGSRGRTRSSPATITVGSTTVLNGTSGNALTDNGGILGQSKIRTVQLADANYYIATTGSDSNPGTLALPFATLTHAMQIIADNIDGSGFQVFVNIGAGSFQGLGLLPTTDVSALYFLGAGRTSTTILTGPNDGIINDGSCCSVAFPMSPQINWDNVTFNCDTGSAPDHIAIYAPFTVFSIGRFTDTGHCDCGFTGSSQIFFTDKPGYIPFGSYGSSVITLDLSTLATTAISIGNPIFVLGGIYTIIGSPSVTFIVAVHAELQEFGPPSFVGAVAGLSCDARDGTVVSATIQAAGTGISIDNSSSLIAPDNYGNPGFRSIAGLPTTTNLATNTDGDFQDTVGGGLYLSANLNGKILLNAYAASEVSLHANCGGL